MFSSSACTVSNSQPLDCLYSWMTLANGWFRGCYSPWLYLRGGTAWTPHYVSVTFTHKIGQLCVCCSSYTIHILEYTHFRVLLPDVDVALLWLNSSSWPASGLLCSQLLVVNLVLPTHFRIYMYLLDLSACLFPSNKLPLTQSGLSVCRRFLVLQDWNPTAWMLLKTNQQCL